MDASGLRSCATTTMAAPVVSRTRLMRSTISACAARSSAAEWLVEQQQFRAEDRRVRESDSLALTARKTVERLIR